VTTAACERHEHGPRITATTDYAACIQRTDVRHTAHRCASADIAVLLWTRGAHPLAALTGAQARPVPFRRPGGHGLGGGCSQAQDAGVVEGQQQLALLESSDEEGSQLDG
jgi:hypothetical protein